MSLAETMSVESSGSFEAAARLSRLSPVGRRSA